MLGCFSIVALLAVAIAAGLGKLSFWWAIVPAFVAGGFGLSNGPGFDVVMQAGREGRFSVFPRMLAIEVLMHLAVAGAAFEITRVLS